MISSAGMNHGTQSGIEDMKAVENMNSDVCTKSTKGEKIRKAGEDPEMENVTSRVGANFGMEGVTDVTSTTHSPSSPFFRHLLHGSARVFALSTL